MLVPAHGQDTMLPIFKLIQKLNMCFNSGLIGYMIRNLYS